MAKNEIESLKEAEKAQRESQPNNSRQEQEHRVFTAFQKKYKGAQKSFNLMRCYFMVVDEPWEKYNGKSTELYHKAQEEQQKKEKTQSLEGKSIKVYMKASPNGKIFGSVTNKELADAIEQTYGQKVDKRTIEAPEIKEFGTFGFKVNLGDDIIANMNVEVVQQQ